MKNGSGIRSPPTLLLSSDSTADGGWRRTLATSGPIVIRIAQPIDPKTAAMLGDRSSRRSMTTSEAAADLTNAFAQDGRHKLRDQSIRVAGPARRDPEARMTA